MLMMNIHFRAEWKGGNVHTCSVSPSKKKERGRKKKKEGKKRIHLSYLSEHLPSLTGPSSSRVTGTLGDICPNR